MMLILASAGDAYLMDLICDFALSIHRAQYYPQPYTTALTPNKAKTKLPIAFKEVPTCCLFGGGGRMAGRSIGLEAL